jgi:hypothetical protein
MAKTNDALKILQQMTSEDPEMEELIEESSILHHSQQAFYEQASCLLLTMVQDMRYNQLSTVNCQLLYIVPLRKS